jgi:hypothetical protein
MPALNFPTTMKWTIILLVLFVYIIISPGASVCSYSFMLPLVRKIMDVNEH